MHLPLRWQLCNCDSALLNKITAYGDDNVVHFLVCVVDNVASVAQNNMAVYHGQVDTWQQLGLQHYTLLSRRGIVLTHTLNMFQFCKYTTNSLKFKFF